MTDKQEKNYQYFTKNISKFLTDDKYKDKYLVIAEEKIYSSFDTFEAALEYALNNCPEDEFIIQQAIDESMNINYVHCGF